MIAEELINKLKPYKDFEVQFSFSECIDGDKFLTVRKFSDIRISDIGHSNKIVVLGGDEADLPGVNYGNCNECDKRYERLKHFSALIADAEKFVNKNEMSK